MNHSPMTSVLSHRSDVANPGREPGVGRAGVTDPDLNSIAQKVERGERLTRDDGLTLFRSSDLLTIGRLADLANQRKNGDRVCFAANQHINPTNVCILRNTCVFCSFARMPQEDGAYTRSLDEVFAEADAARDNPTREFHIVGGLHPKLSLDYYLEMFRGLKARHPDVHIKALTAVEVAHLARIEKLSTAEVLRAMKDAGVTSLPGGGAEVFSPATRATIADRKLTGDEWLAVHREAHQIGLPSNCTMLYGHVETMEERVDHLLALRGLQDETGGFLTYIPLAYHPDHNELGEALGRTGTATTGFDDLKNLAVGRLVLDNIPHVKTHWPMVTPFISQVALGFGCDDLEGTVVFERVYHEAGAGTPMWLSYDEIVGLIRAAGKTPVERDSLYRTVRTFENWVPGQRAAPKEGPEGPTFHIEHRATVKGKGKKQLPVVAGVVDALE
jgi:aminodeoxyfutalosine synthase